MPTQSLGRISSTLMDNITKAWRNYRSAFCARNIHTLILTDIAGQKRNFAQKCRVVYPPISCILYTLALDLPPSDTFRPQSIESSALYHLLTHKTPQSVSTLHVPKAQILGLVGPWSRLACHLTASPISTGFPITAQRVQDPILVRSGIVCNVDQWQVSVDDCRTGFRNASIRITAEYPRAISVVRERT